VDDYLRAGNVMTEELAMSIAAGAETHGDATNVIDSWDVIEHAFLPAQVPLTVAEVILRTAASSPRREHRTFCVTLLSRMLTCSGKVSVRAYNAVLGSLIGRLTKNSEDRQGRYDLARSIYHDMIERGLHPTSKTLTYLVNGQVELGMLDDGLTSFKLATRAGIALRSDVVGRLIVNLFKRGRVDESVGVAREWRQVAAPNQSEAGVAGACTVISAAAGNSIDWHAMLPGYRPNRHFRRYVARVARLHAKRQVQETPCKVARTVSAIKPRVPPPTMSWVASDNLSGGGWLESIAGRSQRVRETEDKRRMGTCLN
jgi:hypothetical protein